MEKKNYLKPDAAYVLFYSDEDITSAVGSVQDNANADDPTLDLGPSVSEGSGDENPEWGWKD